MASCYTGVLAAACTQGKRTQHGKPQGEVSDDQPNAREGQVGRLGVAERFVLPLRPGNSGGGKGPQFKTDAIPVLRTLSLCTCRRQYPGVATGRTLRSTRPAVSAFPDMAVGSAYTSPFR